MKKPRVTASDYQRRALYYVSRGVSFQQAIANLRRDYSDVRTPRFERFYNHYQTSQNLASRFNRSGNNRTLVSAELSRLGRSSTMIRYHITYKFVNPITARVETRGEIVDLEYGLSKKQVLAKVKQQIVDLLNVQYTLRKRDRGLTISQRVRELRTSHIEGI